jgi:hypothetical protein
MTSTNIGNRVLDALSRDLARFQRALAEGHEPACMDLQDDIPGIVDAFLEGFPLPPSVREAAEALQSCAICRQAVITETESLGGRVPAWWTGTARGAFSRLLESIQRFTAAAGNLTLARLEPAAALPGVLFRGERRAMDRPGAGEVLPGGSLFEVRPGEPMTLEFRSEGRPRHALIWIVEPGEDEQPDTAVLCFPEEEAGVHKRPALEPNSRFVLRFSETDVSRPSERFVIGLWSDEVPLDGILDRWLGSSRTAEDLAFLVEAIPVDVRDRVLCDRASYRVVPR